MNIKYFNKLVGLFLLPGVLAGCRKQIELGPPPTLVASSNVFSDNSTATAAQLSLYAQMQSFPYSLHRITGLSSDELVTSAIDQTSKNLYANALDATIDGSSINIWSTCYNYIYQANAIIEGLQNNIGVSENVKKQLQGESFFLRGFYYFYLVNLYENIPLMTSTDYKRNASMSNASRDVVYRQIVTDLTKAASILNSKYVDATDTVVTAERVRPTTWASAALLARTYLYMGKYDSAEVQSNIVIGNTSQFGLVSDLTKVFAKNSSEAIWQMSPIGTNLFTGDGTNFILMTVPGTGLGNSSWISSQLINAFEMNDKRRVNWINSYSSANPSGTWNYPFKYRDNSKATTLNEYTMMLRLAEQYLIRAEAKAQQGNTINGITDLNIIRKRAGLPDYAGATDKASVLDAIQHERQVELFCEGDRWINLKRVGTIDNVMGGASGVTKAKGGNWDTHSQLYPIPAGDIRNNPNLIQNKGY